MVLDVWMRNTFPGANETTGHQRRSATGPSSDEEPPGSNGNHVPPLEIAVPTHRLNTLLKHDHSGNIQWWLVEAVSV